MQQTSATTASGLTCTLTVTAAVTADLAFNMRGFHVGVISSCFSHMHTYLQLQRIMCYRQAFLTALLQPKSDDGLTRHGLLKWQVQLSLSLNTAQASSKPRITVPQATYSTLLVIKVHSTSRWYCHQQPVPRWPWGQGLAVKSLHSLCYPPSYH